MNPTDFNAIKTIYKLDISLLFFLLLLTFANIIHLNMYLLK